MSGPQKWKYHKEKGACIVQNNEEEAALGPGWWDSPAHVDYPWPETAKAPLTAPAPAEPTKKLEEPPAQDAPLPTPALEPDPAPRRRRRNA